MSRILAGRLGGALLLLGFALPALTFADHAERTAGARVVDSITGEPIAEVTVVAGGRVVATGAAGRFTLAVADNSTLVTVRRIGYRAITLRAGDLPSEIRLHRAAVVLTSLGVTASAASRHGLGEGTQLGLATTRREAIVECAAPALAEAMQTTEGVSTSRPGNWGSKAYLRGLGGERVAVLLDGNRLNRACCVSMDAGLACVSPDNIERVEVLAGPGSTLYGSGNVGGVINVVTRGPREELPLQGEVRLSASSAVPGGRVGGTVWGRRDRLAFTAALDAASYGDQRSPEGTVDGSSFRDAMVDVAGSYGIGLPHRLDARVQRYAGRDIGYPGSGNASIPEEDRLLLALDYGLQASRGILDGVNAKLYLQSLDHHMIMSMIKLSAMPGGQAMRSVTDAVSGSDTWGGRAQARLGLPRGVNLDAGLEATQWNAEGTRWVERQSMGGTTTMEFRSWPGVRVADLGAFAQGSVSITSWLGAGAGARLDDVVRRAEGFPTTTEWVPSGNVGLRVTHPRGAFARAALGFGYRIPDPTELYGLLLRPDGFLYSGEPDLATETSRNVELSLGWTTARARASASVYRNEITDFISTIVTGDSISGLPVRRYRNVADARIDGVTGSLSAPVFSWLDLRGAVSYTRGENRNTGAPLPLIAPLEGSLAGRITPRAPWLWVEPEMLAAVEQGRPAVSQGEVETPGFAVLNLRAGRAFGRTNVTVGVENVLDNSFRRHLDPQRILRPGRNAFVKVVQQL